ncbi:MAG: aspartyl protease [Verrucomicrobia bacterium]|nr:MAG: aspartyl protease [Verrucomicrobiota bacterium]
MNTDKDSAAKPQPERGHSCPQQRASDPMTTRIRVQNWLDAELIAVGSRKEKPRAVEIDALVDTGAVKFYLKSSVIRQLGLRPIGEIKSRTMSDRAEMRKVFSPVSLEIQGRTGRFDVVEVPDSIPNIVGQIPLEDMDWVVDCRNQKLIPNPEHKHGELSDEF